MVTACRERAMIDHDGAGSVPRVRSPAVRVATRGSALALRQAELVAEALRAHRPDLTVTLVVVHTAGDRNPQAPIPSLGDGVFVRGVEAELFAGRADIAVHSAKDLPTAETPGLVLAAFPPRADAGDVLVSRDGATLATLPAGARVGTGSPRRAALVRARRPDVAVVSIRGNVDTRLRRLHEGVCDAVVLAAAGLERLLLAGHVSEKLDPTTWLPAPGQGALAVQCRRGDSAEEWLAALDDAATRAAVTAERAVLRRLGSGCRTPVGAYARPEGSGLVLRAALIAPDGTAEVRAAAGAPLADAERLGVAVAEELLAKGAHLVGPT
jgi:hydroxymethylbilane synthase